MKAKDWIVVKDDSIEGYTLTQLKTPGDDAISFILRGKDVSESEDDDYYYLKAGDKVVVRISKKQKKVKINP